MYHLIFDTETTGLPKDFNAPASDTDNWPRLVQLSWIISDGVNSKEFDFIIKPEGFEIPEEASKIHGITTERAMREGIDLKLVLTLFWASVLGSETLVAHNLEFDYKIIGAEVYRSSKNGEDYELHFLKAQKFDTMKEAVTFRHFTKWPHLWELYQCLFGEPFEGAHNSLNDVRATARCYFEMIKK
jgi:DNA polymerase-3 subunit alpha